MACSGTGYIGSFTSLTLLQNGYDVVIVDSLYNSSKVAVDRIELLSGKRPHFYQVDVTDKAGLDEVFKKHPEIDSVIHFAALKVSSFAPLPCPSTARTNMIDHRLSASLARFLSSTTVLMLPAPSPSSRP